MKSFAYWLLIKEETTSGSPPWVLNHDDWHSYLDLHDQDRAEDESHHDFATRHKKHMQNHLSKEPMIFVDMDETLAKVVKGIKDEWKTIADGDNERWSVRIRPDAVEFLQKLRKYGKIYVLSEWRTEFEQEILRIGDLLSLVDGVFGYDNWQHMPRSSKAILIDNKATFHIAHKLVAIGVKHITDGYGTNDHRHIEVHPFDGDLKDKHSLLAVLPDVEEILDGWDEP